MSSRSGVATLRTAIHLLLTYLLTSLIVWSLCSYERLLKRARVENFSDLTARRFLYQSGFSKRGEPIVVLIGRNLPSSLSLADKVLQTSCMREKSVLICIYGWCAGTIVGRQTYYQVSCGSAQVFHTHLSLLPQQQRQQQRPFNGL